MEGVRVTISLAGTEVLVSNCKHHSLSPTMFPKIRARKKKAIWQAPLSEQKLWRKPGRIR